MKNYKGYTYYLTATTTTKRYQRAGRWLERTLRLYEIEGLKPAGKRPFLTNERQVHDYINSAVEGLPPMRGDVPQRIQSARARRGMTQQELGEALGYSGNSAIVTVSRWEAGTRPVPRDKIRALCDLLGLDPLIFLP